jgi:hypothetical protein
MPSSDKQLAFSVIASSPKLLNKGKNVINMSQGSSLLPKDKSHAEDSVKVVGTKRLHTDAPSNPVYHNVYVRRKVESEHSKLSSSQELKGNGRDKTKKQEDQKNMESEHSKCNSSQELKDNGSEKRREQEEHQVQHDQASKPEMPPPTTESGIKELEEQQMVQHDQVNKPEVPPLIAESGRKDEGQQKVQHDQINQPEVALEVQPLIAESGIKEEGWQKVQHDQVNQPELAPPIVESGIKEEERQTVQHDQVNKPEVAPAIAEAGTKEEELKVLNDQVNTPQVAPSVADSGGLVPSEMAPPIAKSVGLVPSESPEKANAVLEEYEPDVASANEPPATPGTAVQGDIHSSSNQNSYWSERYNRLQTYLENCDRSSQEGYMRSKTFFWHHSLLVHCIFPLTLLTWSPDYSA